MNKTLSDLLPHSPFAGPPVPRFLPPWPMTIQDVDRAVRHYHESGIRAMSRFNDTVEKYRRSLIERLP